MIEGSVADVHSTEREEHLKEMHESQPQRPEHVEHPFTLECCDGSAIGDESPLLVHDFFRRKNEPLEKLPWDALMTFRNADMLCAWAFLAP